MSLDKIRELLATPVPDPKDPEDTPEKQQNRAADKAFKFLNSLKSNTAISNVFGQLLPALQARLMAAYQRHENTRKVASKKAKDAAAKREAEKSEGDKRTPEEKRARADAKRDRYRLTKRYKRIVNDPLDELVDRPTYQEVEDVIEAIERIWMFSSPYQKKRMQQGLESVATIKWIDDDDGIVEEATVAFDPEENEVHVYMLMDYEMNSGKALTSRERHNLVTDDPAEAMGWIALQTGLDFEQPALDPETLARLQKKLVPPEGFKMLDASLVSYYKYFDVETGERLETPLTGRQARALIVELGIEDKIQDF